MDGFLKRERSSMPRPRRRAGGGPPRGRRARALLVAAATVATSACLVRKSTYRSVVDELAETRAQHREEVAALRAAREQAEAGLQMEVDSLRALLQTTRVALRDAEDLVAAQRSRLETEAGQRNRLESNLQQTGEEAERLRERLRTLSDIEAEVRQRNQIYEEMLSRFRSLIDGGQLSVAIVRGRMVLQLPQDILFPSGSATLNAEGTRTLRRIGEVLADIPGRRFQVEGHTDNVPISTERFPSNWELSTARALSVVRLLVREGVAPDNLSGAGYGEFQPVASNDSAEGRRANRRIEIVMLPNLDVLGDLGSGG